MEIKSYQTFKKHNPNLQVYSCQDSTLGITYTVEPTMRKLGYYPISCINETTKHGTPLSIYDKPKDFVKKWLSENDFKKYKECVYYVWFVRQENSTKCIDLFFK